MSPDYGATQVATIAADALTAHTGTPAAVHAEPADVTAAPAASVEPGDPFVEFHNLSGTQVRVSWLVRLVVGRWEAATGITAAVDAYRAAAAALRTHHYDVGPLAPPYVVEIAGQPHLVATFPTHHLHRS